MTLESLLYGLLRRRLICLYVFNKEISGALAPADVPEQDVSLLPVESVALG